MKRSLVLFAILLVVCFVSDRMVALVLEKLEKNIYSGQGVGKVNAFRKVKDSLDVVVLGSSRAAHHVDPSFFEGNGFNMGMDGTKMGYASALIKVLEKKGQTILLHIDHNNLYEKEYDGDDLSRLTYLVLEDPIIKNHFSRFRKEDLVLTKISNAYAFNGKLFPILKNAILKSGNKYNDSKGYEPLFPTSNQRKMFAILLKGKEGQQGTDLSDDINEVNPMVFSLLRSIIDHANMHDMKLIFFTSPSLNAVDQRIRNQTKTVFEELKVPYFDHLDFFKEFNQNLWKDETHLSDQGASRYTQYLIQQLGQLR